MPDSDASTLSPRQQEVLLLVAQGLSTKQVARHLGISYKTAETDRATLMMKLGVHSLAGLVQCAVRMRLVDPCRHDFVPPQPLAARL